MIGITNYYLKAFPNACPQEPCKVKNCPCRCFPLHICTEQFVMAFAPYTLTSHHTMSCKTPLPCCCRSLKEWVTRALNLIHSHYLWLTWGALTCIPCTHCSWQATPLLTWPKVQQTFHKQQGKGGCAIYPICPKGSLYIKRYLLRRLETSLWWRSLLEELRKPGKHILLSAFQIAYHGYLLQMCFSLSLTWFILLLFLNYWAIFALKTTYFYTV